MCVGKKRWNGRYEERDRQIETETESVCVFLYSESRLEE